MIVDDALVEEVATVLHSQACACDDDCCYLKDALISDARAVLDFLLSKGDPVGRHDDGKGGWRFDYATDDDPELPSWTTHSCRRLVLLSPWRPVEGQP